MQRIHSNPLHLVNYMLSNANAPLPTVLMPQVNLLDFLCLLCFCAIKLFLCLFPYIMQKSFSFEKDFMVEHTGFEPVTSTMRM